MLKLTENIMSLRILGIDPGSQVTGYGIVDFKKNKTEYAASGTIRLTQSSFFDKLHFLYRELSSLIEKYQPTSVSLENIFFSRNVRSALKLGHTRGVIIINALEHRLPVSEYSPKEMKMAITGNGNATKPQVQYMIKKILSVDQTLSFDESDALGLAICCIHRMKSSPTQYKNWKEYIIKHPELIKH